MNPPKISVIIPVYNDRDNLRKCLTALMASSYKNFECVVIDDASTDGSAAVARDFDVAVLELPQNAGPACARNLGSRQARGEILFFTDADCEVHADTLLKVSETFEGDAALAAVSGCYDDCPGDPAFVSQFKNLFHHYIHNIAKESTQTFWAACGAIKRQVFLDAGGFNDSNFRFPSIEDIELGSRLFKLQKKMLLRKDLQVRHNKHWQLWNLIKTDVLHRGIPWTRLMLENKVFPNDLNVQASQKISVFIIYFLIFFSPFLPFNMVLLVSWIAGILLIILMNRGFYKFFVKKKGFFFTIRVTPLHLLYFGYCGVGFLGGLAVYLFYRLQSDSQKGSDRNLAKA